MKRNAPDYPLDVWGVFNNKPNTRIIPKTNIIRFNHHNYNPKGSRDPCGTKYKSIDDSMKRYKEYLEVTLK